MRVQGNGKEEDQEGILSRMEAGDVRRRPTREFNLIDPTIFILGII